MSTSRQHHQQNQQERHELEQRHAALESQRNGKRKRLEHLAAQKLEIEQQMKQLDEELQGLDVDIDRIETDMAVMDQGAMEASIQQQQQMMMMIVKSEMQTAATQADEILTDPATEATLTMATQADEVLTEPQSAERKSAAAFDYSTNVEDILDDDDDDDEIEEVYNRRPTTSSASSSAGTMGVLQFTATAATDARRHQPAAAAPENTGACNNTNNKPKTIDEFFQRKNPPPLQPVHVQNSNQPAPLPLQKLPQQRQHQQQLSTNNFDSTSNNSPGGSFPWSQKMMQLLNHTFHIQQFRDNQKEIIDATLQGNDVFVIMRTGGGKSLTYQLPSILEGRHNPAAKVTFVVSPLLSLIQDQVEQMNQFCPGSAVSFTSNIGATEHARRWGLVRDRTCGICLVFVTPEKVSKSNKLCAELDKLFQQGRLGRFVIDEAHCACQWGHDFRPDYAQLGKLKSHFPSIPVIAVTATASDRVRQDVCDILRLGTNYRFFRSTANRPNLTYSVSPKPSEQKGVIAEMAEFIKQRYPTGAGIVYTYSRKDANVVADALCDYGVVAEAYHSDVTAHQKELVHRSWMRNETQVVVATIAFGLGINKPDVRFVLHHSISKTLEAYYQESGRAGRDGNPAECVLYYSPKDVIRLLKMVHGTSSEHLLMPMVRYSQESGNDAVCKSIILTHLGEPNAPDVLRIRQENEGVTTTPRDVGRHAQNLVRLLDERLAEGKDMTMAMLLKDWRTTSASAPQYIQDNPPGKDGLSPDSCERIIISLLLEKVLSANPVWTAYDTVIYFVLGPKGRAILQSPNPNFIVRLPNEEPKKAAPTITKASKHSKARKAVADDGDWLAAKPKAKKRKKAATKAKGSKATKKKTKAKTKTVTTKKRAAKAAPAKSTSTHTKSKPADSEVIDLLSDDDDDSVDVPLASLKRDSSKSAEETLWDDEESDEECEFE